jgi:hypothetical protein
MIVYRPRVTSESPEPDLTVIHSPVVPFYSAGAELRTLQVYARMLIYILYIYLDLPLLRPYSSAFVVLTCPCPGWRLRVVKHDGRSAGGHTRYPWTVTVSSNLEQIRVWSGGREDGRRSSPDAFYMHNRLVNSKLALTMHASHA